MSPARMQVRARAGRGPGRPMGAPSRSLPRNYRVGGRPGPGTSGHEEAAAGPYFALGHAWVGTVLAAMLLIAATADPPPPDMMLYSPMLPMIYYILYIMMCFDPLHCTDPPAMLYRSLKFIFLEAPLPKQIPSHYLRAQRPLAAHCCQPDP